MTRGFSRPPFGLNLWLRPGSTLLTKVRMLSIFFGGLEMVMGGKAFKKLRLKWIDKHVKMQIQIVSIGDFNSCHPFFHIFSWVFF